MDENGINEFKSMTNIEAVREYSRIEKSIRECNVHQAMFLTMSAKSEVIIQLSAARYKTLRHLAEMARVFDE